MQYLMDYEDKKFQNVSKEGLKLGKDSKLKDLKESFKELTDWWKKALESENVDSVKISNRLHNTPLRCCHLQVRVERQHGEDHAGADPLGLEQAGLHARQAGARDQPQAPHHQGAPRQGGPGQRGTSPSFCLLCFQGLRLCSSPDATTHGHSID